MSDYSTMSNEELIRLHEHHSKNAVIYKVKESTAKIALNSLYGALANQYFTFYRTEDAEAITTTGQFMIRYMALRVNEKIRKATEMITKKDCTDKNFLIYIDTDSVTGDSVIPYNDTYITIEEAFNLGGTVKVSDETVKNYVIEPNATTLTVDPKSRELVTKKIKYIMKHRVCKQMFRVTVDGESVICTEDHGLMVLRRNRLIEVTPLDVKPGDIILKTFEEYHEKEIREYKEFTIEPLGVQELDVYDLEVEDTHCFFANNILVHNSNYFDINDIVTAIRGNKNNKELVDTVDALVEKVVQPSIDLAFHDATHNLNTFENHMAAKREAIAESGFWTGKKRYAMMVHDVEGVRYETPKLKVTGMETQRSSTPARVREWLSEAFTIVLTKSEKEFQDYIEEVRKKFRSFDIDEISFPRSINNMEKYVDSNNMPRAGVTTPINISAAAAFNRLNAERGWKLDEIRSSDKIKFFMLKQPNFVGTHVFGYKDFLDERVREVILPFVDYDLMFEKTFLAPLETVCQSIKWSTEEVSSLDDFF